MLHVVQGHYRDPSMIHELPRLYLEPVAGHALLVLGDEVGAFLLGVVGGGEEHALVALCLFICAHAAGLGLLAVVGAARAGRMRTFGFAGAAAAVFLRSAPMLAAVGGAVSGELVGRGRVGRAVQTDLKPLRERVWVWCGGVGSQKRRRCLAIDMSSIDCHVLPIHVTHSCHALVQSNQMRRLARPAACRAARDPAHLTNKPHQHCWLPKTTAAPLPLPHLLPRFLHDTWLLRLFLCTITTNHHVFLQDLLPRGQGPQAHHG